MTKPASQAVRERVAFPNNLRGAREEHERLSIVIEALLASRERLREALRNYSYESHHGFTARFTLENDDEALRALIGEG